MDSENKFWLGIWSLIAGVTIVFIIAVTTVSLESKATFLKAVQAGHDPLKVTCSMGIAQNEIAMCTTIAEHK